MELAEFDSIISSYDSNVIDNDILSRNGSSKPMVLYILGVKQLGEFFST